MQQTEVYLKKRHGKFILYLFAAFFCASVGISSLINLIGSGFDWFVAGVALVTLIGLAVTVSGLMPYLTYGNVLLVVESDGETITFYNKNQAGKVFNKSEAIPLAPIQRFYVIRKKTRYFSSNYAFGYDKSMALSNGEISAFPSLFEATQTQMQSVLQFVKSSRPEIELGYENFFQKLAKKR